MEEPRAVLNWFNGIEHKEKFTFIAFDVVDFYPSISVDLLSAALQFASGYVKVVLYPKMDQKVCLNMVKKDQLCGIALKKRN